MGPVDNPWLKGYMCGGSTSGGAALVAVSAVRAYRKRHGIRAPEDDGLGEGVDMAIGGDQGGSIRIVRWKWTPRRSRMFTLTLLDSPAALVVYMV